jgi:hypothetical protein
MGDTLKKVQPGQSLRIPAQTFNTMIDAARDYLARQQSVGGAAQPAPLPQGVVLVRNDTGEDRNLFEIVALDGPVFTPGENEDGFKFRFALKGITPDRDHLGNFAILLEPVKDGEIGRALLEGITPVKVQVDVEGQQYADVCTDEGDECLHLKTADAGAAHILWIESGTGEKWAVVRLANPAPRVQGAVVQRRFDVDGIVIGRENKYPECFCYFLEAKLCDLDGENVRDRTVILKASAKQDAEGSRGVFPHLLKDAMPPGWDPILVSTVTFTQIKDGDVIGFVWGNGTETVGEDIPVDGYVVAHAGKDGAVPHVVLFEEFWAHITSKAGSWYYNFRESDRWGIPLSEGRTGVALEANCRSDVPVDPGGATVRIVVDRTLETADYTFVWGGGQEYNDGPGIKIEGREGETKQFISVDLSENCEPSQPSGLQFTDTTDAGKLQVKPDENRGIAVTVDGVEVREGRGIDFDGDGKVVADIDETKGLAFSAPVGDASKVQVKPDTDHGIDLEAGGAGVRTKIADGLDYDAAGNMVVKPRPDCGIEVDANGVAVKANNSEAVHVDADGVGVTLEDAGGLEFGAGGGIQIKPDPTKPSIDTSADGVSVKINECDGGLEHNEAGLQVKADFNRGIEADGDGVYVKITPDEGLEYEGDGGLGLGPPGPFAYMAEASCSLYLDKNGRIMGWYVPLGGPPWQEWYSPWGYEEPY